VEPRKISSKGKGKLRDEGDEMLDLLVRASERRLTSQSFTGSQLKEMDINIRREKEKAKFVEDLLDSVGDRRMGNQDATFVDLEARREKREKERMDEMVSLPEFIREELPRLPPTSVPETREKEKKKPKLGRHRSLSAPGLGWLLHRDRHQDKDKEKPMESLTEASALSISSGL
jgi:hypothetical protein